MTYGQKVTDGMGNEWMVTGQDEEHVYLSRPAVVNGKQTDGRFTFTANREMMEEMEAAKAASVAVIGNGLYVRTKAARKTYLAAQPRVRFA